MRHACLYLQAPLTVRGSLRLSFSRMFTEISLVLSLQLLQALFITHDVQKTDRTSHLSVVPRVGYG
jgi:hypothetical protein